jgi:hypothetical protein
MCPYSAQNYTDNTYNRKSTKLFCFTVIIDFSVSYWLLLLYRKNRILFPDDFKPLAFTNSPTPACKAD